MKPHGIYDNTATMQREQWQCGVLVGYASWVTLRVRPWGFYNDLPKDKLCSTQK
jgi:hypothetical protein